MIGKRVSHYWIVEKLGEGGMRLSMMPAASNSTTLPPHKKFFYEKPPVNYCKPLI
jgi:hypothetical protein